MSAPITSFLRINIKEKLLALATHMGASFAVYFVFLLTVRFIWYPDFYYNVLNVQPILVVLFMVDIILGPLLTFVIYKKDKPKLKFDISVIVIFQLAAFLYGGSVVYKERPLYMVYSIDRFVVVTASSINTDEINSPELKKNLPAIVGSELPENEKERKALLWNLMEEGVNIEYHTQIYQPMDRVKKDLTKHGVPISALPEKIIKEIGNKWPDVLNKNVRAYPMLPNKSADQLLIWNIDEQKMIGLIKKDPWIIIEKSKKEPQN